VHPSGSYQTVIDVALDSLHLSGRLRLKVTGTSMLPAIHSGSYVSVSKMDLARVEPGNIVLVRSNHGLRLHRLIRIEWSAAGAVAITRGDNNDSDDPPVAAEGLLAVLHAIEQPSAGKRWISRLRASWIQRLESPLKDTLKTWLPKPSR
jgi:signal peptidase I